MQQYTRMSISIGVSSIVWSVAFSVLFMNSLLKFNTTLNATLNSTNLGTLSIFFCLRLQYHCNSSRMLNLNADLLWILYRKKSTYLYSCPEIVIADHEKFSFQPILEFMKKYTSTYNYFSKQIFFSSSSVEGK